MAHYSDTHIFIPTDELEIRESLVGQSDAMRACLRLAGAAAQADVPVMIAGEGGSGKSLLARHIHAKSPRSALPCVNLRCANLGAEELRNRLFGGTAGGVFAAAAGGVVIFDGVDRMPWAGQCELQGILSSPGEWRGARLFSTVTRGRGAQPHFVPEALALLLSEAIIRVPPLRERREDVDGLAERALRAANGTSGRRIAGFSPLALDLLRKYDFPGNVRELFFVVNRAVRQARRDALFAEDFRITANDGADDAAGGAPLLSLEEAERRHIGRVLLRTGWKKSAAARVLRIPETLLNRKMTLYELEREQ